MDLGRRPVGGQSGPGTTAIWRPKRAWDGAHSATNVALGPSWGERALNGFHAQVDGRSLPTCLLVGDRSLPTCLFISSVREANVCSLISVHFLDSPFTTYLILRHFCIFAYFPQPQEGQKIVGVFSWKSAREARREFFCRYIRKILRKSWEIPQENFAASPFTSYLFPFAHTFD